MWQRFESLALREVAIPNPPSPFPPMCEYLEDGFPTDWHLVHLGQPGRGGSRTGLPPKATAACCREGRISPQGFGDLE